VSARVRLLAGRRTRFLTPTLARFRFRQRPPPVKCPAFCFLLCQSFVVSGTSPLLRVLHLVLSMVRCSRGLPGQLSFRIVVQPAHTADCQWSLEEISCVYALSEQLGHWRPALTPRSSLSPLGLWCTLLQQNKWYVRVACCIRYPRQCRALRGGTEPSFQTHGFN
jgi:hypothetical protein